MKKLTAIFPDDANINLDDLIKKSFYFCLQEEPKKPMRSYKPSKAPSFGKQRPSNKTMILDMLSIAGSNGLSVIEMLNQNSHFKRSTISSQLSHWTKDGIVINTKGRYYLKPT